LSKRIFRPQGQAKAQLSLSLHAINERDLKFLRRLPVFNL
jgi:hypothetical protein